MWVAVLIAYNKTIDVVFRILDWSKGRPKAKLEDRRMILEDESRAAQIKGDVHEMVRVRAQIEDIDRKLKSGDYS
jgi:hypothetical protein